MGDRASGDSGSARPSRDEMLSDIARIDGGESYDKFVTKKGGAGDGSGSSNEDEHGRDTSDLDDDHDSDQDEVDEEDEHGREPSKPKKKSTATDDDSDEEKEESDEDEDEDLDEEESDEDEDAEVDADEEDEDEDADETPDTKKRVQALKTQEKRMRAEVVSARAEVEQRAKVLDERATKIEKFEKLMDRARVDPAALLIAAGLTPEDLEFASQDIYAHSKKGGEDPKLKDQVGRIRRQREKDDELAATRKEVDGLKKSLEERDAKAAIERDVNEYSDRLVRVAKKFDKTPLVREFAAKHPKAARAALQEIAAELAGDGTVPSPHTVARVLERRRARILRESGIDPTTVAKKAPAASSKGETTTKTKKTEKSAGPKSPAEKRAELERELSDPSFKPKFD